MAICQTFDVQHLKTAIRAWTLWFNAHDLSMMSLCYWSPNLVWDQVSSLSHGRQHFGKIPTNFMLFVCASADQTNIGTAQFWLTNKPVHIIFQFINIQKMDADFFFFINASFVQNWIKVVIFLIFGTVGSCLKISKHQLFLCEDSLKRPGLMKQQNEQNGNNLWWK